MPNNKSKSAIGPMQENNSHQAWDPVAYAQTETPNIVFRYNGKKHADNAIQHRLACYSPNDRLGSGTFGTVYAAGVYSVNYELKKLTHKNKEKVVKVILNVDHEKKKQILAEYAQGKKAPHLGMKEPVFTGSEGNQTCYLVMNLFPGEELFNLINSGEIKKLSNEQKLELTYKLLLALYSQVTVPGIVHRDLKPENILVQLKPVICVYIVDYGLAKEKNGKNQDTVGSFPYIAPEMLEFTGHDIACDVFSMARVISEMWVNDSSGFSCTNPYGGFDIQKMLNNSVYAADKLQSTFTAKSEHPNLLTLLIKMLDRNKNTRITIEQAIDNFEQAYPQIKSSIAKQTASVDNTGNKTSTGSTGEITFFNNKTRTTQDPMNEKAKPLSTSPIPR